MTLRKREDTGDWKKHEITLWRTRFGSGLQNEWVSEWVSGNVTVLYPEILCVCILTCLEWTGYLCVRTALSCVRTTCQYRLCLPSLTCLTCHSPYVVGICPSAPPVSVPRIFHHIIRHTEIKSFLQTGVCGPLSVRSLVYPGSNF